MSIWSNLRMAAPLPNSGLLIELGFVVSAMISSELALRLPLAGTVHTLTGIMQAARRVLFSRNVSDRWKEIVLPVYAFRIFLSSLVIPLLLTAILAPIIVAIILLSPSLSAALDYITNITNLLLIAITSIVYLVVRIRFNAGLFKT
jgi:hypothetical protein